MSSILFYSTRMRKKLKNFRIFFQKFLLVRFFGLSHSAKNVKGDLKKTYLTSISSASRSSVTFSVSSSQLIKLIKYVTSLVFKKVTTIVCVFLRKAPTKKILKGIMTIETITEVLRECKYDRLNNSNISTTNKGQEKIGQPKN